jgi:Protein kinase domain
VREWTPGTLIRGKYLILGTLGRGGMGVVYKAEHLALEELRALKVMTQELASDQRFLRRFHQEARAARCLQHPHIVRVDDLDQTEEGSLFIAMEYVDGVSLRDLLRATRRTAVAFSCSLKTFWPFWTWLYALVMLVCAAGFSLGGGGPYAAKIDVFVGDVAAGVGFVEHFAARAVSVVQPVYPLQGLPIWGLTRTHGSMFFL